MYAVKSRKKLLVKAIGSLKTLPSIPRVGGLYLLPGRGMIA
jgi:hypothetical protein